MCKTDYLGIHDRMYVRKKADGEPGWTSADDTKLMRSFILRYLERAGFPFSGKLLELGCGNGTLTRLLAGDGFQIYGVDISPTAIGWAQEKAAEEGVAAEFQVGSVLELPFEDGQFDVVVDGHCSHCIIGGDRKAFWSEAFRVTRSGGAFIAMSMCGDFHPGADAHPELEFDPVTRLVTARGIAGRYIGLAEDVMEEIRQAGFAIKYWERTGSEGEQEDINILAVKP